MYQKSLADLHTADNQLSLAWICENSEQLTAELFVNRSTVGPINVGGRVLFPCDGERAGMFICLHVNKHSGGGVERPLLEFLGSEAVELVDGSAHSSTHVYTPHVDGKKNTFFPSVFRQFVHTGCRFFS